jgi:FkbM family methyltransferase
MGIVRRLRAFAVFAAQVARLAPTPAGRAGNALAAVYLLARQYVPRLPRRAFRLRIERGGRRFAVAVDAYGDVDVVHELYVRGEYEGIELPASARTVVDLGANIGLSVLDFRARYPEARIVACEPDPAAFAKLSRTTADDPLVEVHNVAIADADGERTFYTSSTAVVSGFHQTLGDQQAVTVRAVTLASLWREAGVEEVDLLKIDVEGAETEVLADPAPLARVGAVVGEIHERIIERDAEDFVAERLPGFEVHVVDRPGEGHDDVRLFYGRRQPQSIP